MIPFEASVRLFRAFQMDVKICCSEKLKKKLQIPSLKYDIFKKACRKWLYTNRELSFESWKTGEKLRLTDQLRLQNEINCQNLLLEYKTPGFK